MNMYMSNPDYEMYLRQIEMNQQISSMMGGIGNSLSGQMLGAYQQQKPSSNDELLLLLED